MPEGTTDRNAGEIFLSNIKARIKRLGMSQVEAGVKAGFKYRQISQLLSRSSNPTLSTMERLAAMVDAPLHRLLDPSFDPWAEPEGSDNG
jgi:transcriptional regulator with XRE-family HTH domain